MTGGIYAQENAAEPQRTWYVGISGGAQVLFSSDAENLKFSERLTPSVSLTFGKWFSPIVGARLQVGGYGLNGYSTTKGLYLADPLTDGFLYGNNDPVRNEATILPDGSYRHSLRYINAHIDLTLSMFNLFNKNNTSRWDIIPAVGIGYFGTFDYKGMPSVNSISTNFSILTNFAITETFDAHLEVASTVLPGSFDGRITDKLYESTLSLSLGVNYKFSTFKLSKKKNGATEPQIVERIVHVVTDTVKIERERIVEVEKEIRRENFEIASIRFKYGKAYPNKGQEGQYINIQKYLAANPNARIKIEGYGDRKTGTTENNLKISQQRAENISEILVTEYNINEERVEIIGIGSEVQPYSKNDWNRTVVVTVIEE